MRGALAALLAVAGLAGCARAPAGPTRPAPTPEGEVAARRAFDALLALDGEWIATESGKDFPARFEVVSARSAVLQRSGFLAAYYLDFDGVMVTCFPDDGFQMRFRARGLAPDGKTLDFRLLDATNLRSGVAHGTRFTIELRSADELVQRWWWTDGTTETAIEILFRRLR